MGLTYHDVIRAFQSGTSYTVGCSGCSTMDPELYVAGAVEDDRGPMVEYSLQRRPTHLLWRGHRTEAGLRYPVVLRRIGRDAP